MSFFRRKPTTSPAAPAAARRRRGRRRPSGSVLTGDYTIDASHSRLGFSARHAMVTTVRGNFDDFDGTAHVDAETPANSSVNLTIRTASINTALRRPRRHLRSGDFFDADAHPEITFASTSVERDGTDVDHHRRPDHQGHHALGHHPLRGERHRPGPVRQRPHRLRGRDDDQPQGLGPHLERRARDRRRPRLREDQARVRRLGDQERLSSPRRSPTAHREERGGVVRHAPTSSRSRASALTSTGLSSPCRVATTRSTPGVPTRGT